MFKSVKSRLLIVTLSLIAVICIYAYIYMYGMANFEGREIPYYVALQKATESITTAGFGGHAPWEHPVMNFLVIIMNITGVTLFFVGVPVAVAPFLVPILKESMREHAPEEVDMEDHVVLIGFSDSDQLINKILDQAGVPRLFIVEERDKADELYKMGESVMYGDVYKKQTFENANISESRAVVVNVAEGEDPSVILSIKNVESGANVIGVTESIGTKKYIEKAGADHIIMPKSELGKSLGLRATENISEKINTRLSKGNVYTEERIIKENDSICGKTIREAGNELNNKIIAGWFLGNFVVDPDPSLKLEENTILLLANDNTNRSSEYNTDSDMGKILICGYGSVGKSVEETVQRKGYETITIDKDDPGADIEGNIMNEQVLLDAGVKDAKAVVVTVSNDEVAVYTNLVVNELSPSIDLVTRSNTNENVWKMYDSGSDFVLSLETLTADAIASLVIDDKIMISPSEDIELSIIEPEESDYDKMIKNTDIKDDIGMIIAIERDDKVLTDIGSDTKINRDDRMLVVRSSG